MTRKEIKIELQNIYDESLDILMDNGGDYVEAYDYLLNEIDDIIKYIENNDT